MVEPNDELGAHISFPSPQPSGLSKNSEDDKDKSARPYSDFYLLAIINEKKKEKFKK